MLSATQKHNLVPDPQWGAFSHLSFFAIVVGNGESHDFVVVAADRLSVVIVSFDRLL
jgi:hypothetical protein